MAASLKRESPESLVGIAKRIKQALNAHGPKLGTLSLRAASEINTGIYEGKVECADDDEPDPLLGSERADEYVEYGCINEEPEMDEDEVAELVAKGKPSPFGDMTKLATVVDKQVRDAVHYTEHPLIDKRAEHVASVKDYANLAARLFGCECIFVPKKLNIYSVGGHFAPHKDTPVADPRHLGTMIVVLCSAAKGGKLRFHLTSGRTRDCDDKYYNVFIFPSYEVHEVTKVEEGTRITVAFDVMRKDEIPKEVKLPNIAKVDHKINERVKDFVIMHAKNPKPFGIMLANKYSVHQIQPHGRDAVLLEALESAGFTTLWFKHVIVDTKSSRDVGGWAESKYDEYTYNVYEAGPDYIDSVMDGKALPAAAAAVSDRVFYMYDRMHKTLVHEHHEAGAEHTGNESAPSVHEMRYYAAAVLVD